MKEQTIAAMDIGTNSVRLLIAKKEKNRIIPQQMFVKTTRLGEGLDVSGIISKEAIIRTVHELKQMQKYIDESQTRIVAVATSAVRDACNANELLAAIKTATGIDVKVISGRQEALLSYRGALSAIEFSSPIVVVDIGGGSTEIVFKNNGDFKVFSSNVGAVRCTENSASPTKIFEILKEPLDNVRELDSFKLLAVGGTATTLAAIHKQLSVYDPEKIHASSVNIVDLAEIMFDLAGKSPDERKKVPGLQPERANIIVAGLLILWVIMTYLHCDEVVISEADILNGIVLSVSEK